MRRILFLYSGLGVGGAERQLALLVTRLPDRGFDPLVATLRVRGRYFDELRESGVPVWHAGMRSRTDVRGALRALRLSRARPEIVVTQSVDAQLVGHAVARQARAFHVTVEQGGPGLRSHRRRRHRLAARLVAPRVDRVIAVTAAQVPDLESVGYRRDAIRVVPNAVPESVPGRSSDVVREELGLARDHVVVLLVATLRSEKRPDRFLDAVAAAHALHPGVRGVVAGGGPLLTEIRARAKGLEGIVNVLGERSDVSDLIGAGDIVCLSSDVEGIPLSVLEAMALAKPVVATDVGGMSDVVDDGVTGLLVPASNTEAFARSIVALASDPDRARALGEAAQARFLERFTVERMVDAYVRVFEEALEKRPRSGNRGESS